MAREKIAIKASQACFFNFRANESLTADRVISASEIQQFQGFYFTPTASRNCDLPAEEVCAGALILIKNAAGGAYTLTVRDDAAGTVVALTQGQCGLIACNGTAWFEVSS